MHRDGHEQAEFFLGYEVEHSPAHGLYTLFVVGCQPPAKIFEYLEKYKDSDTPIEHVYFGANRSFPIHIKTNDYEKWREWEAMIDAVLARDIYCTFDFNICQIEGLLEAGFCEYDKFIPMISAPMPYIRLLGYNAVLKLDDKDFKSTNPGVWCHCVHDLTKRDGIFTPWSEYTKDKVL
jgi:hypothetical protein